MRIQPRGARAFFLMAAFAPMLAGCGPSAPEYKGPVADLSASREDIAPMDAPVKAGAIQAVTLGSNVEAFLKYNDEGRKFAASVGAGQKLLDEADPQHLVDGSINVLRRIYPKIVAVDSLAAARAKKADTTFVVDIRNKAGIWPGDQTTVDIDIVAFDARMKPVSRIVGHGAIQIKPYVVPEIGLANREALSNLDAKARQYFR
ncbi:MAG: hypothetical protein U1E19_01370 [Rhodoblastus sp.]